MPNPRKNRCWWHPAPAVTTRPVVVPEGKRYTRVGPTQRSQQQSHKSMRHILNDRLLHLVTSFPSIPRCRWGLDPLLLPSRGRKGTGGTEIETFWLCIWVRVAVSKVLCYVCHAWAGPCRTTLVPAVTPTTPPHIPLYQQHHWSKTLNALGSESSTTTLHLAYSLFLYRLNV